MGTGAMSRLSEGEAREDLSGALDRVAREGERIVVHRSDEDMAVLIPVADYALLRRLEDEADLEAIREAKEEPGADIPWEDLKAELGL